MAGLYFYYRYQLGTEFLTYSLEEVYSGKHVFQNQTREGSKFSVLLLNSYVMLVK